MPNITKFSSEYTESLEDQGLYKLPALRLLSEITASLSTNVDIEQLLERFLSTMIRLAGAGAGVVRVLTSDGTGLRLIGAQGLPQNVLDREHIVPVDCGFCGQAAQSAETIFVEDVYLCQNKTELAFFGDHCVNFVAIPLRHKGQLLGVYNLFMFADAPAIPAEVQLLFTSISEHLGMALENSRLTRENMRISLMNERQMLSHKIHDSLAQTLAYLNMRLAMLKHAINHQNQPSTEKYLGDLEDGLDSAYSGLRELITQFHHRMDPRGLIPALDDLLADVCKKTEAHVDFGNHTQGMNLTPDQEVQVFHIVQEALANICKHAQAKNIHLRIEQIGHTYQFTVKDDGIGFPVATRPNLDQHFGINIMHGRAAQLSGKLDITSETNLGTLLILTFPVHATQAEKNASLF